VAVLSVVIGACVGCTCESGWSGHPVWWRCTAEVAASDGGRGDSLG
jgi:hypothetical protein